MGNLGKHFLSCSMRLLYILVAFFGFSRVSKASLFQARSGRWEVCQYQEDDHGQQKLLGACVPGTDCQQLKGEESLYGVDTWKTFRSSISRSGRVVKTVRYKVERCNNELRDLEAENLIPDSQTFDNKICSRTAHHTDEYLVRDPEDCRRFYSCQRTLGTSNSLGTLGTLDTPGWVARHMSCAPGTHFDGARCQAGEQCLEHVEGSTTGEPRNERPQTTSISDIPTTTTTITTVAPVEASTTSTPTTGAPAIMTTSILTTISHETPATTTTATTTTTSASSNTSIDMSSASTATTSTTIFTPSTTTTISTTTIPQTSQETTITPASPAIKTTSPTTTSSTTSSTTTPTPTTTTTSST